MSTLRQFVPPILLEPAKRARDRVRGADALFGGSDSLFKAAVGGAAVYAEYGCGASTIWACRNSGARVLAVDTSESWIAQVHAEVGDAATLHWTDLGPLGEWGRPVSYERREHFRDYTDWIWQQDVTPDVVLVDGRFRVACFLTSLANAVPGTEILFDDYRGRPHYHVVEQVLAASDFCGRQALFVVPPREQIDGDLLQELLEAFRYVMD